MIDHTLLKPTASESQVRQLCTEALEYGFAAVCINPIWVSLSASLLSGSRSQVCSVVGFPLGTNTTEVKAAEARHCIADGATEVDMVINVAALQSGDFAVVYSDIAQVAHTAHAESALLKVIIETCYLADQEKIAACTLAKAAGADFVKTSTGFGPAGATIADVRLMRRAVGLDVGVKAAGGIRSLEDALAMVAAGANRIGTSSGVGIIREARRLGDRGEGGN
jgi:deoxyribose-phosphate aldolase